MIGPLAVARKPAGTIYAHLSSGFWKSTDSGNSFALLPAQPDPGADNFTSLTVQQASPYAVYVGLSEDFSQSSPPNAYVSTDNGESWQPATGLGVNMSNNQGPAVLAAPGSNVLVSAYGYGSALEDAYACNVSKDNGMSLLNACGTLSSVATSNPSSLFVDSKTLFAADYDGALYRLPFTQIK